MDVTLDGKVAIVTGAASGIGLATAAAFLAAGASVVGVDRAAGVPGEFGAAAAEGRFRYVAGDVRTDAAAGAFTAAAVDAFGRVDVLVNNAGVSVVKALHEHDEAEWDAVMDTNVKAIYWAARHVVPVMIRQRAGVILNTGSISGEAGIPGQGAYGASKGAVHQMTRQMAVEYAPHGIRVNAVCCGTIDTPIVHGAAATTPDPAAFWKMLRDGHPIGRVGTAAEVADFFTFLASDRATFFTGSLLMLDGGYTAR